jgi:hypothetical protein
MANVKLISMKNRYEIRKYPLSGTSFIEVRGPSFSCEDLYEIVGKNQYMSTFRFKTGSEASSKFGQSVTGVVFYDKDELALLSGFDKDCTELGDRRVRIDSPARELTISQCEDLKYGGVLAADIEYISYIPYKTPEQRHETGEKKVPNIIYIPYTADPKVDYDILYQNYIASRINSKTELIPYEKEKFIGITLGINDGHIDSRLLDYLGFDVEKVQASTRIWYHLYKTKERRKKISEEEKSRLTDLEIIRMSEILTKLFSEIKRSGVNPEELTRSGPIFETIISSISKFEPSILLYGERPIFWDMDSYLHIVLRHVKQLQLGHFKKKSPFPYKFEDLADLIEQVLRTIEREIRRHFAEKIGKDFRRVGKMSVLFNGDYYCLQINKEGKLVTLYVNG